MSGQNVFFSKEALGSIPWLLVGKLLTFFLYLIISTLIVRGLGPVEYGLYSLFSSYSDYLMVICALGLNTALLRFLPELVHRGDRRGFKSFLQLSFMLQSASLFTCSLLLYSLSLFSSSFPLHHLPLFLLFTAMLVLKEYFNNLFTSLFMARFLAITSTVQALLFFTWLMCYKTFTLHNILLAYALSIAAIVVISAIKLYFFLKSWKSSRELPGIDCRRIMRLATPMMINTMINRLLQQYSEVFFLGYFASPAIVGYYSLAFTTVNLLLNFIPMALHTLFTSAFTEAYTKKRESLKELIEALFQVLILLTVPLSCFSFFYIPTLIPMIYGDEMSAAGPIASFFSLLQLLAMIWIPLSMAITATEKVRATVWVSFLQLLVNLVLDYFFIKYLLLDGAILAKGLTFLLLFPIKIRVIRKILGGIYLPFLFFLRFFSLSFALSGLLYTLFPHPSALTMAFVTLCYLVIGVAMTRIFKLIGEEDVKRFRQLESRPIHRVLKFLGVT